MNLTDEEKDIRIEEQAATIRLLTDLTKAGSWVINYAPDGSVESVKWGDGFRRLMGYRDPSDFPDKIESFVNGFYPEDRDELFSDLNADAYDEKVMSSAFAERTAPSGGIAVWAYCPGIPKEGRCSTKA